MKILQKYLAVSTINFSNEKPKLHQKKKLMVKFLLLIKMERSVRELEIELAFKTLNMYCFLHD